MGSSAPINFGAVTKNASSVKPFDLEMFDNIATFWRAGEEVAQNTYIRPRETTGFSYQATTGGQAGPEEPVWPTTVDQTVEDGTITWTAKAAGANGVAAQSSPSAAVRPTGELAVDSVALVDGTATNSRIRVTLSSGVAGKDYVVYGTVTAGSNTLTFELLVRVR